MKIKRELLDKVITAVRRVENCCYDPPTDEYNETFIKRLKEECVEIEEPDYLEEVNRFRHAFIREIQKTESYTIKQKENLLLDLKILNEKFEEAIKQLKENK